MFGKRSITDVRPAQPAPAAAPKPAAASPAPPGGGGDRLAPLSSRSLLPMFPLGTDFDEEEQRLVPALQWLKRSTAGWPARLALVMGLAHREPISAEDSRALGRMGLGAPRGVRERVMRGLVALALRRSKPP